VPPEPGCIATAVPFWHFAARRNAFEPVKRTSTSCGPLLCTVTWNPSAGTALCRTAALPWHATVIDPPASEKVLAATPGVTEVAGSVVVVVVSSGGGVPVDTPGAVTVVVVTTVGVWRAVGNVVVVVVVVVADAALARIAGVDEPVDGRVGCVGDDVERVGTLQVVIAPCPDRDDVATLATPGAGMTGSGGEAIALVTAPTPTQLTTVAAAVATTQAALGRSITRRIQQFSSPQQQVRTKPTIIRRRRLRPVPLDDTPCSVRWERGRRIPRRLRDGPRSKAAFDVVGRPDRRGPSPAPSTLVTDDSN
jgi:hypothetical protein